MKVKELIELLQQFNSESELMLSQNGGEYHSDLQFMEVKVDVEGVVWLCD